MTAPRKAASSTPRLVVVATHPIQYHAPLFRALADCDEIDIVVLFVSIPDAKRQGEGFGIEFHWDVPLLDGYAWRQARTTHLAGQGFFGFRVIDPIAQLRELRPDVVLISGWQSLALLQFWRAARRFGVPVLLRGESSALKRRLPAVRMLHRLLLRHADAFLAIGRSNRAFYAANCVPDRKIFDAPYFVDNAFFSVRADDARRDRGALRARFGIPDDATCFLFAGKLQAKKHPGDAVEAIVRLTAPAASAKAFLLIVGTGELEATLRSRVASLGAPVAFAGFLNQSEIAGAYAAADALVLPSDAGETWGLVVNEAMACGLPAIVSDRVGCGPDLVEPGVTGELYPFGDVAALAKVMQAWCEAPARREALGKAARDRVATAYTVERSRRAIADATLALLSPAREAPAAGARKGVVPCGE